MKVLKALAVLTFIGLWQHAFSTPDLDTRVRDLEKKLNNITTTTANGQLGITTTPAGPHIREGLFVSADILYWHVKLGGTEFTYTEEDSFYQLPLRGSFKEMNFDWDFGFRVGAGYRFEYDAWDLFFNYTNYNTADSSKISIDSLGLLIPLRANFAIVGALTDASVDFVYCKQASSDLNLDYDNIDLELGRNYFLSKALSLRPFFGAKSSWIDTNQIIRYTGGVIVKNNTVQVKDFNHFWGIGPQVGFNGKWHLYNGFSVFENASAAFLFSYFKVKHREYFSLDPADQQIRLTADMHRFSPFGQIALGLSYDKDFEKKNQHIGLSLGYEVNYYWRINQTLHDYTYTTNGERSKYSRYAEDLSFYGLSFNFRWDF